MFLLKHTKTINAPPNLGPPPPCLIVYGCLIVSGRLTGLYRGRRRPSPNWREFCLPCRTPGACPLHRGRRGPPGQIMWAWRGARSDYNFIHFRFASLLASCPFRTGFWLALCSSAPPGPPGFLSPPCHPFTCEPLFLPISPSRSAYVCVCGYACQSTHMLIPHICLYFRFGLEGS